MRAGTTAFNAHTLAPRTWPATAFSHIEMTWHDNFTADLVVDGIAIYTALPLSTMWATGRVTFEYGVSYVNGAGDCSAVLDNVLVDGDL